MNYFSAHKTQMYVKVCQRLVECKLCVARTADEGTEEYQRVSRNVGKGLTVIQEELHRMRMSTKARVDSLAIQREVSS